VEHRILGNLLEVVPNLDSHLEVVPILGNLLEVVPILGSLLEGVPNLDSPQPDEELNLDSLRVVEQSLDNFQ